MSHTFCLSSGQLEIPVEKNGRMTQSMEMIPLISKSEAKDSLITLDYVSIQCQNVYDLFNCSTGISFVKQLIQSLF